MLIRTHNIGAFNCFTASFISHSTVNNATPFKTITLVYVIINNNKATVILCDGE